MYSIHPLNAMCFAWAVYLQLDRKDNEREREMKKLGRQTETQCARDVYVIKWRLCLLAEEGKRERANQRIKHRGEGEGR